MSARGQVLQSRARGHARGQVLQSRTVRVGLRGKPLTRPTT